MKFLILSIFVVASTLAVDKSDLTEERYVCYAPSGNDYGDECKATFKLDGGDDVKLMYSIMITNPDRERVWCEGRAFIKGDSDKRPEMKWFLLGGGVDKYEYTVPWQVDSEQPSVRCRSLGTSSHLIEYVASLVQ